MPAAPPFARTLRAARLRAGWTQQDLAERAATTTRYLSFMETGRSRPSEEMVLRLARALGAPLREQNRWLLAAGFTPRHPERPLALALAPVQPVIDRMLAAYEPFPAWVIDARWRLHQSNQGGARLLAALQVVPGDENFLLAFLESPVVLAALENRDELLAFALDALERDQLATNSPALAADLARLRAVAPSLPPLPSSPLPPVVGPRLRVGPDVIHTLSTVCRFGNAADVTLEELRVEVLLPAEERSAALLRALLAPPPPA